MNLENFWELYIGTFLESSSTPIAISTPIKDTVILMRGTKKIY